MVKIDGRKLKRLKRINQIHRLIQQYGCLTHTQLVFLTGYSPSALSSYLGELTARGKVKRYFCRAKSLGRGSVKYNSYQLFGNFGGKTYYCSSEEAFINLCLQYITSDPKQGISRALTHHFKTMKISPLGIRKIHSKRIREKLKRERK